VSWLAEGERQLTGAGGEVEEAAGPVGSGAQPQRVEEPMGISRTVAGVILGESGEGVGWMDRGEWVTVFLHGVVAEPAQVLGLGVVRGHFRMIRCGR
jgi:hypothetical protein